MKTQFIVTENDKEKRKYFYNYITNKYNFKIYYPYTKENFIKSNFPFVIDFKEKGFWVCESITCCAGATKNILTIDEYLKQEKTIKIR